MIKPFKADAWSYAKQEACQHWINCLDGALALVDQEQKLDPNGGTVFNDDVISMRHIYDVTMKSFLFVQMKSSFRNF